MPPLTDNSETLASGFWRLLIRIWWRVLIIGGSVFALYRLRSLLITLIVTAVIAYVLDPLVVWLSGWKPFIQAHGKIVGWNSALKSQIFRKAPPAFPSSLTSHQVRTFAVIWVALITVFVVWWGGKLVAAPFSEEIKKISSKQGQQEFSSKKDDALAWYDRSVPEKIRSPKIIEAIQKTNFADPLKQMAPTIGKRVSEIFSGVVELVLIPVLALYVLIDGRELKHEMTGLFHKRFRREGMYLLREFNRIMRAFIFGQFLLCFIAFVIVFVGLALLHIQYSFILAVFAGLTRAIPVVGPIFGAIPIIILLWAEKGVGVAVTFTIFFSLLHLIETKLIMPYLLGKQVELHPVIIITSLLIGSEAGHLFLGDQMGGLLGMFFAVPCAALIRVMLRRYWLRLHERTKLTETLIAPHRAESVDSEMRETL